MEEKSRMSFRRIFGKPLLAQLQPQRLRSSSANRSQNTTLASSYEASFRGSMTSLNSTTVGSTGSEQSDPNPSADTQCLLGYNQYIRALLEQQIVKQAHAEKKNKCNDQLDIFRQQLTEVQLKETELKAKIDERAKRKLLQHLIEELQGVIVHLKAAVLDDHVTKQVNLLEGVLEAPANKLYLNNMGAFIHDQENYDRLECLIENCIIQISLILKNVGNVDGLNSLGIAIEELNEKVISGANALSDLEKMNETVAKSTLKAVSDMFAYNN